MGEGRGGRAALGREAATQTSRDGEGQGASEKWRLSLSFMPYFFFLFSKRGKTGDVYLTTCKMLLESLLLLYHVVGRGKCWQYFSKMMNDEKKKWSNYQAQEKSKVTEIENIMWSD